jgi:integrase
MSQLGWESRKANRQQEEEQILHAAMKLFRQHLPEMLEESPDASQFESKWSTIDLVLQQSLKSEKAYRRAHSFICTQLEAGNRHGIWSVKVPDAFITLRRNRPARTLKWQQYSLTMANTEQSWFHNQESTETEPNKLFAKILVSMSLYGGLNRPALWFEVGVALSQPHPLRGDSHCCWLLLRPTPSQKHASNAYEWMGALNENTAICEVNYVPDPVSLGLLRQFLQHKPTDWQSPNSEAACQLLIKNELGIVGSARLLSHGGITIAEHQPGVDLPQVRVEYAIGRQASASLPERYWQRLIRPGLCVCHDVKFHGFKTLNRNAVRVKQANGPVAAGSAFLATRLKEIFKKDPARPQGKSQVISKLNELIEPDLQPGEQILIGWLISHLEDRDNAISTAKLYLECIGNEWLLATLDEALDSYSGEDFNDIYQSILNRRHSLKAREYRAARLEDLHHFGVQRHDLPPLPFPLIESSSSIAHVSAAIVDEVLFTGLLHQLDLFTDLAEIQRRMLKTYLIMAYRTGLRPGELAKLRLKDIEASPTAWLFVRNNRHGRNKTDAGLRKVPLFPLLTNTESQLVGQFLSERRLNSKSASELMFHVPENLYEPLDCQQLSLVVKKVLFDLTGGIYYRLYHLRHSALSRLQLLLHHDQVTLPPVVDALLPYTSARRFEILHLISGKGRQRDRYAALATLAGHAGPEITLSTYLHFTDLLLGLHLTTNERVFPHAAAQSLLGLRPHRIGQLTKNGTQITPAKTADFLRKRLNGNFSIPPRQTQAPKHKSDLSDPRQSHYIQSLAVLGKIQAGYDYRETASIYRLDEEKVQAWLDAAKALLSLPTEKGQSRLFPKSRRHQLLPPEPVGIEERRDIASALKQCRKLYADPATKDELLWVIKYLLTHCNSSRAGIKFTSPKDFKRFMSLASKLFPWRRWHILLQYPYKKKVIGWCCHPELMIYRKVLKKTAQYQSGMARLYLRHSKENERRQSNQSRYSSHSLRILFHRLAIIFFNAKQIQQWQVEEIRE